MRSLYAKGLTTTDLRQHPLTYLVQLHDVINPPHRNRLTWHTKDHAAGLILREGVGTRPVHLQQASGSIIAHPREDHPDRIAPGILRHRTEKNVNRRTVTINRGSIMDPHLVVGTTPGQFQVPITGAI